MFSSSYLLSPHLPPTGSRMVSDMTSDLAESCDTPHLNWEVLGSRGLLIRPPHSPSRASIFGSSFSSPRQDDVRLDIHNGKRPKLGDFKAARSHPDWPLGGASPGPESDSESECIAKDDSLVDDESCNTPASSAPGDESGSFDSPSREGIAWNSEPVQDTDSRNLTAAESQLQRFELGHDTNGNSTTLGQKTRYLNTSQAPLHLQSILFPSARHLLPASVTPSDNSTTLNEPITSQSAKRLSRVSATVPVLRESSLKSNPPISIEPILLLSRTEKKVRLIERLTKYGATFPNPQQAIFQYGGNDSSDGIHVFVDSSNITINFQQVLRKTRSMSHHVFHKSAPISFHSLALVMERGRHVAKRVLVGSSTRLDRPPLYMFQAEKCGYEVSNLARVEKLKTGKDVRKRGTRGSGYGTGSGSEGPSALYQISEQGVDEILHLKMMESLMDYDPGILVLATGDAAEAEYSGGFLVMIERAMKKGWKVELIAWRSGMSYAYRSAEFLTKWAGQFTIVYLDDFSEELLSIYTVTNQSGKVQMKV